MPCLVDRTGVQPTRIGALPAQCAALNRTFLNVVELTVRAALEGSREHVYHAAMLDPNASGSLDLDTVRVICDELIDAHGDALPRPGVSGLDLLVVGDVNADLVLRGGDLVPRSASASSWSTRRRWCSAARARSWRRARRGSGCGWRWRAASATTCSGGRCSSSLAGVDVARGAPRRRADRDQRRARARRTTARS